MSQTPPPGSTDEQAHDEAIRHRYLIRFEEDTLRQRPLWIRVIIEFVGTAVLVLVAAGSGRDQPVRRAGPRSPVRRPWWRPGRWSWR